MWVFPSPRKSRDSHLTDDYAFYKVLALSALDAHATPHDLRRSYESALYHAGVDIGAVAALMGHKNPATAAALCTQAREDQARGAREGVDVRLRGRLAGRAFGPPTGLVVLDETLLSAVRWLQRRKMGH